MKKKFINLSFFIFSLWGIFTFSCGSSSLVEGENTDNNSTGKKSNSNNNSSSDNKSVLQKTREEAFLEVVKVLHAPYNSGDKFFKIFTGTSETKEEKDGNAVSISNDSSVGGKGKWSVKAGKENEKKFFDRENLIVYIYEGFQPKGSKIIIDGKMISTYRSKSGTSEAIGFNQIDAKLTDRLTISGEYEAKLYFIYPNAGVYSEITKDNYEDKLIGDAGMFTKKWWSSIEFTYDGKTKNLTKEEIQKLITVA